jgi:hypothetical protein
MKHEPPNSRNSDTPSALPPLDFLKDQPENPGADYPVVITTLPIPQVDVPGTLPRYPFKMLDVGEAFIVPYMRAEREMIARAVRRFISSNGGLGRLFKISPKGMDWLVERIR